MFPISDEDQAGRRHLPYVTWAILIINVLVFLYEVMLGTGLPQLISTYGAVPREILTGQDLPPPGPYPLYLQLLTSMFLHGGWLHLIGNMAYLRVFGDDMEDALGPAFYLLFYLGAGLVASLVRTPAMRRERGQTDETVDRLLARLGLAGRAEELAKHLPYGEQKRVEIARALASEPRLLLLDEPAAGTSVGEAAELMALIRGLREAGLTILLVEHHIRVVCRSPTASPCSTTGS